MSREIIVYADWSCFSKPMKVGLLRVSQIRSTEHFSFSYDNNWLSLGEAQSIDPELQLYAGSQYSQSDNNFRTFLDSCPDRWGRLLMQRREAVLARKEKRKSDRLTESDYLLGVHDHYRMGALRFKTNEAGNFLDNNDKAASPPISTLRELEYAVSQIENDVQIDDDEYLKWLYMLISPGSSLGGARPKSSITDENQDLWIAKFPSKNDEHDVAAWEFLTSILAADAGIPMAKSRIDRFNNGYHTFLTKRFDRVGTKRLHFSSAMTQLGYYDGDDGASYLELAQFLIEYGSNTKSDLAQLWRRIIFNIAVSNTDDHLRNHGFLFQNKGWILSPAYDVNPVAITHGLHLNINELDNSLDYDLAMEVIDFFRLSKSEADIIYNDVIESVKNWRSLAKKLKISRSEQKRMETAFNI